MTAHDLVAQLAEYGATIVMSGGMLTIQDPAHTLDLADLAEAVLVCAFA